MLSNAYLLAKIRFDTAENEPAKNSDVQKLQKFAEFANFADPKPRTLTLTPAGWEVQHGARRRRADVPGPRRRGEREAHDGRLAPQPPVFAVP